MRKPIIAIDGPAATGKSTVAREVAARLGYQFISSGSLYRGIAFEAKKHGLHIDQISEIEKQAKSLNFSFSTDEAGDVNTFINGEDVTHDLRLEEIGHLASKIAMHKNIRDIVVGILQKTGEHGGLVMEGRDIQTVVFPDAEVKIYLSATAETRAKRRFDELTAKGLSDSEITVEAILDDIKQRDERDFMREFSPLLAADDAVVIETDDKTIDEVVSSAILIAHRLTIDVPFEIATRTDLGYIREVNEDGFLVYDRGLIMAIADGMGGHEHGEIASELALKEVAAASPKMASIDYDKIVDAMYMTCQQANTVISQRATLEGAELKMGTTLTFTLFSNDRLYYLNVGDSRLYLLRNNDFIRLTHDHSLVQEMVDNHEITPEEAAFHPYKNRITRVVGYQQDVEPDIASIKLIEGDRLLLSTDGLHGTITEENIKTILEDDTAPKEQANTLIEEVLSAGAPDNVTVIIAHYKGVGNGETVDKGDVAAAAQKEIENKKKRLPLASIFITAALFIAIVILGGFLHYKNPIYVIKLSKKSNLVYIYKTFPLLPFLNDRLDSVDYPLLSKDEVAPYLKKYNLDGNLEEGFTRENYDDAVNIMYEIAKDVAAGLIKEIDSSGKESDNSFYTQRLDELLKNRRIGDEFTGWKEEGHIITGDGSEKGDNTTTQKP